MKKEKGLVIEIENIVKELVSLLGVDVNVLVEKDDSEDETNYLVNISGQSQAGLLIGANGSTLQAIQSFISMSVRQRTGEWSRIILDIDGWREKHEDHLKEIATQAAERVKTTGEPQHLYNLTPAQRRVIHMILSKESGLATESKGEGEGRYLIISAE